MPSSSKPKIHRLLPGRETAALCTGGPDLLGRLLFAG